MRTGIKLISEEYEKRISEGKTTEYNMRYQEGELANAASCYAMTPILRGCDQPLEYYPWKNDWNPTPEDRIQELTKAGALIAAEIDRLTKIRNDTKMMNREKITKVLDNIPSEITCNGRDIRLIITGTFLLYMNGLIDNFEDVDILVVNGNEEFWGDILALDYLYKIEKAGDYDCIKMKVGDITYNLIGCDEYPNTINPFADWNGDIELDTISHALKAKKRLDREKDRIYFEGLIDQIMNI